MIIISNIENKEVIKLSFGNEKGNENYIKARSQQLASFPKQD